ncbi:CMF_collapsed_G0045290.mRNA.1.CDS.1 [Saccharomyces cerevisiae]|nr:CMF_collapsed_G0045290.mRNA.1.CDS.1 [Saccharomyces cerevisiae]
MDTGLTSTKLSSLETIKRKLNQLLQKVPCKYSASSTSTSTSATSTSSISIGVETSAVPQTTSASTSHDSDPNTLKTNLSLGKPCIIF